MFERVNLKIPRKLLTANIFIDTTWLSWLRLLKETRESVCRELTVLLISISNKGKHRLLLGAQRRCCWALDVEVLSIKGTALGRVGNFAVSHILLVRQGFLAANVGTNGHAVHQNHGSGPSTPPRLAKAVSVLLSLTHLSLMCHCAPKYGQIH